VTASNASGRPDTRRGPVGRHAPGEPAQAGIEPEALAHLIPPTIPAFTARDLQRWLLDERLAVIDAHGRLTATAKTIELVAALAP
jgi:hypothetical protein